MKAVYGTGMNRGKVGSDKSHDCLCVTSHKATPKPAKDCKACGGTGKRQPLKMKGFF